MIDLPGLAIADHYFYTKPAKLWVEDLFGPKVEMPLLTYFRSEHNLPTLEQIALKECRGSVLDIGAAAGSHALILQDHGFEVTALDISPASIEVALQRGVEQVLCADIFSLKDVQYDSLLLLMNGIGLAGTIDGLKRFLVHAKTLLNPGGQLLFDSSDVAYMYDDGIPDLPHYYGEVQCRYRYKRLKTDWFTWLYIDQQMLQTIATELGWKMELLYEDGDDQYLVRLTLFP